MNLVCKNRPEFKLYNVPERKLPAMLFIKNGLLRIWTLDKMTSTQKLTLLQLLRSSQFPIIGVWIPGTGVVEWERFLKGQPQGIAPTRTQNKNDIVEAILYGCPEAEPIPFNDPSAGFRH